MGRGINLKNYTASYTFCVVAPCIWMGHGIVDKVLYFIEDKPGRHLRRIKRAIDFSMGTFDIKLSKLEQIRKIMSARFGFSKYYLLRMY